MKSIILYLLALTGANWLIEYYHLPINPFIIYGAFLLLILLFKIFKEDIKHWGKISFNDAIADELMHIRMDLTELKLKQDKSGLNDFPDEFLKMSAMYSQYPSIGICTSYEDANHNRAKIIIDLSNDVSLFKRPFNSITLRTIKSSKKRFLEEGMNLTVHLHENGIGSCYGKNAKILSIAKNSSDRSLLLTLEISLKSSVEFDPLYPPLANKQELMDPNNIIRKIKISNYLQHGLKTDNRDNSFYENMVAQCKLLPEYANQVLSWAVKNSLKTVIIAETLLLALVFKPMVAWILMLGLVPFIKPIRLSCKSVKS